MNKQDAILEAWRSSEYWRDLAQAAEAEVRRLTKKCELAQNAWGNAGVRAQKAEADRDKLAERVRLLEGLLKDSRNELEEFDKRPHPYLENCSVCELLICIAAALDQKEEERA